MDDTFETETQSQSCSPLDITLRIWCNLLETYTKANLTKASDKLVAISAIARKLKPLIGSRYFAGLWEVNFVPQLAWFCEHGKRSSVYRAPSWSWASIDGEICKDYTLNVGADVYCPLIDILEVATDPVSEDELGQVQGGHIKLLGQLIDLQTLEPDDESHLYSLHKAVLVNGGTVTGVCLYEDGYDMRITTHTNHLLCLPLYIRQSGGREFRGLILECVDDARNVYRRIGLLSHCQNLPHLNLTALKNFDDSLISAIKVMKKTKDGVLVFKRDSSALREIVIV